MPLYRPWQHCRLLGQLLGIILPKVFMLNGFFVESQDIVGRLELGHGHEADLNLGQAD